MGFSRELRFAKGHGTQNDFVLLPDPDGALDLDPTIVAALCHRRSGIGADGLIRMVKTSATPEGRGMDAEWFMDYRNADGSTATMCANGLRVLVAYLEQLNWLTLAGGPVNIGTRAGVKSVRRDGSLLSIDLGPWHFPGGMDALSARSDVTVTLPGCDVALPGLSVDVGNPHVVVELCAANRLEAADLTELPAVRPRPIDGTNVELVRREKESSPGRGRVVMRVHERGVGETLSCGTGAVAAVLAARAWADGDAPSQWDVDVPGGRLRVTVPDGDLAAGPAVLLAGPAVIVAEGRLPWPRAGLRS
jgi:diaminopimelate epimerase